MRKAQSPSHLAVLIFALVVASLVLFFGYRTLTDVNTGAEEAKLAEFKARLERDIQSLVPQFGSFKQITYSLPSSVSELCFTAPSDSFDDSIDDSCKTLTEYPLINDAVQQGDDNVFIIGERFGSFQTNDIETGICKLRCFDVTRGKVVFRMDSTGNAVFLSLP